MPLDGFQGPCVAQGNCSPHSNVVFALFQLMNLLEIALEVNYIEGAHKIPGHFDGIVDVDDLQCKIKSVFKKESKSGEVI